MQAIPVLQCEVYSVTGTSIVAPELSGFFAQENAYLLYLSQTIGATGCWEGGNCYPLGNPNNSIYYAAANDAPHNPFYDITSGNNGYYNAAAGYDLVTGWGAINALQLSWAMNWYIAAEFGPPSVSFGGPAVSHWYNTNQTVTFGIVDTTGNSHPKTGVAGLHCGVGQYLH